DQVRYGSRGTDSTVLIPRHVPRDHRRTGSPDQESEERKDEGHGQSTQAVSELGPVPIPLRDDLVRDFVKPDAARDRDEGARKPEHQPEGKLARGIEA